MADAPYYRVLAYARQLFPDLFSDSPITAADVAGIQVEEPRLEDIQRGWSSQPEEFSYDVEVEGQLPQELRGTFFRNGPGLLEVYGTPLAHPIDGDGMICSLSIHDGKAKFTSKFVKTSAYVQEHQQKKAIYNGMMGTKAPAAENIYKYKNPSNTNVYYWGGKLLSCWEGGYPYKLDPVTLETLGKETLDGAIDQARCLAAHFRHEPQSNTLWTVSMRISRDGKGGNLWIHQFDDHFKLLRQQKHFIEKYYYCHDLLVTEHYVIVQQSPFMKVDDETVKQILEGSSPGQSMRHFPDVPCRYFLFPKDGATPPLVFDSEPCHIYHYLNAYEEGDKVVLAAVCLGKNFTMEFQDHAYLSNASVEPGLIYRYDLNVKEGSIARRQVDRASCEFPTTNTSRNGSPWRFAYLMGSDAPHKPVPYQDIIKFDLWGSHRQVWSARPEYGVIGEPVFVPRPGATQEDDGWVITQLYRCREHKTQFVILDAKDLSKGPIARLHMKQHIPYGFHGTWCPRIFQ